MINNEEFPTEIKIIAVISIFMVFIFPFLLITLTFWTDYMNEITYVEFIKEGFIMFVDSIKYFFSRLI